MVFPLIGRDAEITKIDAALRAVEQGETAAVFVTGGSGVGKSEMMRVVAARARAAGAVVLAGSCLDVGDIPLHPLRHALRSFLADAENATSPQIEVATELIALLDRQTGHPTVLGVPVDRVSGGLHALSEGQPLVLLLDDLQWVDEGTERLLRYLLAGLAGIRVLVVAAVRRDTEPLPAIVSELHRQRSVQIIELGSLNRAATVRLATFIVGRSLSSGEEELIWVRSHGSPYVVEVLARARRGGTAGLPVTLRDATLARVNALSSDSRAVVYTLAAGVEPVRHALLASVVTLTEEDLIESLRTLVERQILDVVDDAYRFRVGVDKEVLESALLPGERVRLHRRYAEMLEAAEDNDARRFRIAHHLRLAGQRRDAVEKAIASARIADRLYQFTEAAKCWDLALAVMAERAAGDLPDLDRPAIWRAAAEAAHRSGEHRRALEILEPLASDATGAMPCWFHTARARYLAAIGRAAEAEAEYERALAAKDCSKREGAIVRAHSADLLVQLGRYAEARHRARGALDLAREVGDSSSEVLASAALGFSQAYLDDPVAGRVVVQDAVRAAEQSGSPVDIGSAYLQMAELLTGPLGDVAEGVRWAQDGASRCESLGIGRTFGARLMAVAANGLFRMGDWVDAGTCVDRGLGHAPSGTEAAELLLARCRIFVGYGDLDAAAADLDAVETLTVDANTRHMLPLLILRAGLAMWRDSNAEARDAVRRGLDLYERGAEDIVLKATLLWHGLRAEAEAMDDGQTADQRTVESLRQMVDGIRPGTVAAAGPVRDAVAGYLALCDAEITRIAGNSDAAAWATAQAVWDARQPYPAAYAGLRQAESMYAQRTRNATADLVLTRAYQTARRIGAGPLTDAIRNLASRARVRLEEPVDHVGKSHPAGPADARHSGPLAQLTDREYEVLELVAEGMTNREAGARLFISPRTVGVHLSHVLGKLRVKSRVQASAIFQRVVSQRDDGANRAL